MTTISQIESKMLEVFVLMKENKMFGIKHTVDFDNGDEMVFDIKIKNKKIKEIK